MNLPRDLSGAELVKRLYRLGYIQVRQTGSHLRLNHKGPPKHPITIPRHKNLRVGTLAAILSDVAQHLKIQRDELLRRLFD